MAVIRIGGFLGRRPQINARLLPEGASQKATNCKLVSGALEPLEGLSNLEPATLPAAISLYRNASPDVWLESTTDVDFLPFPVANDAYGRVIFTDAAASTPPRVTDSSLVGTGGYPANYYRLDVPAPTTSLSAALSGSADNASDTPETRYYVCTYVNSWGAEGPPSPASNEVEWRPGQTVALSNLPSVPSGNYNILWRRIYRVNTAASGITNYQFVSQIAVSTATVNISAITATNPVRVTTSTAHGFLSGYEVVFTGLGGAAGMDELDDNRYFIDVISTTQFQLTGVDGTAYTTYVSGGAVGEISGTTYTDAVATAALGEVLSTTNYDPPNEDMVGLVAHPAGFLAGFFDNVLCLSEPGAPHAWPIEYRLATQHPIIGLGVFGNTIVVTTTSVPYLAIGSDPAAMTLVELEIEQSCLSKRGIADFGSAIAYPSPDGLMLVSSRGVTNATAGIFSPQQWRALTPSSFVAFAYEGLYLCFYDNGDTQAGFMLDPFNPDLGVRDTPIHALGGYKDLEDDTLYLLIDEDIVRWAESDVPLTYTWKSKPILTAKPVNMAAAKVVADDYPVTFRYYVDGVLRAQSTVQSIRAFRLPSGFRGEKHEIELIGNKPVSEVSLATTMTEMSVTV